MSSTRTRGKTVRPIPTSTIRHAGGPGTLWVKRPGHGTYDNDRPPIIHVISRETGEERCWVVGHSDKTTCHGILGEAVPRDAAIVYSDEYRSYHGLELPHATVNHSQHEWARDDDGMACGKCTAIPVKEPARACVRSCDRSAACIKRISTCIWRPTRRSSMPSESHQP